MTEELSLGLIENIESLIRMLGTWFNEHLINIIAIFIGAWIVRKFGAQLITNVLKHTIRPDLYPTKTDRDKRIKTLESLVGAVMRFSVYVIVGVLLMGEINPSYMTALIAGAGLIGVALGFGAQSLIKDFVSGIFIIIENQYRVGDVVEIGGIVGTVQDVTIRTTILRDISGSVHHVPNGIITTTTNKSMGFSKLNELLVVAPDTNIQKLEEVIDKVGKELSNNHRLKKKIIVPPHMGSIQGYAINGISVRISSKTNAGAQWDVRTELFKLLPDALKKAGISVAPATAPIAPTKTTK